MPAPHGQPAFELRRCSLALLFDAAKLVLEAWAGYHSAGTPPDSSVTLLRAKHIGYLHPRPLAVEFTLFSAASKD